MLKTRHKIAFLGREGGVNSQKVKRLIAFYLKLQNSRQTRGLLLLTVLNAGYGMNDVFLRIGVKRQHASLTNTQRG